LTETGNVGTVSFSFDTTYISADPSAGFTERVLLIDSDGDFSSGASIVPLTRNGSAYEANNVDFSTGDYFTFAVIRPEIQFSLVSSNNTEDVNTAQIQVTLNHQIGRDISVTSTQTGGTATETSDYTYTDGLVTIPAGATSATTDITIINDAAVENDETVILTLSAPSIGQLGSNTTHTYTINDDDNFRKANFEIASLSVSEADVSQSVNVTLNAADAVNPTEVFVEISGGSASGNNVDYELDQEITITFDPGDTEEPLPITLINDLIDENDETIELTIVGGNNTTIGTTTTFTLTIQDDDDPPAVQFTSTTQSGDESFQTVNLAVELDAVSGKDITLAFGATGGTATENTDFQLSATSILIPAGSVTDSLTFTVIDDAIEEVPNETIEFTLTDPPTNATLGANSVLTYTILDNDGAGFEGPGGVGNLNAQTAAWLRADDSNSGFSDGVNASSWQDQTTNNNDGLQATSGRQPLYQENLMNNRPALVFDGVDDLIGLLDTDDINTGGPYDKKTIFLAFRTKSDITTRQMLYEEGGGLRGLSIYILNGDLYIGGWNQNNDDGNATTPWPQSTPPFTVNVQRAIAANTNYFIVLQYDFDATPPSFDGDVRASLNGEALTELTGAGRLFAHGDDIGIGSVNGGTVFHDLSSSTTPSPFNGNIAEFVVTNIVYNEAQRRIVYNYLSAKYDINIGSEDIFAYEATHSYDLLGIGRTDAANTHTDAQGSGIVRINNPSNLDDNEFMLIGHNNGSIASWSSAQVPNDNTTDFRRVPRVWRVDETGDVGNISMTISSSDFASPPVGFPENYVLIVDTDGDFTGGSTIYQLSDQGGGLFAANNVDLSGDAYFTVGLAKGRVQFTSTTGNELEDDSPGQIEVTLNYITSDAVTVDYTVADGTATGSGTDYTLANNTLTFNAGQRTRNINVVLTNDTEIEDDEDFTVTLSNPSGDVELGTNTIHTFTINDSDQTRKANLAASAASGLEDASPVQINVTLSESDDTFPTEVYYTVTGTATNGSGEDFELATPGTLTFVATDTEETISFTVNDDAIDELDETVIITLTGGSNAGLGTTTVYTYTIQDNDDPPTIEFDSPTSSGSEGSVNVTIPISISAVSANEVTVNYALNVGSTATSGGGDFNLLGSSIAIPAGQTTANISLTLFNDDITETDETIIIDISAPINATLGTNQQHTFTIIDDDGGLGPIGPAGMGRSLTGSEMVLWLNAEDSVFNNTAGTVLASNGEDAQYWADLSGLDNDATTTVNFPVYTTGAINMRPLVDFTRGNTDQLTIANTDLINTDADNYALKSITVMFRASTDVTNRQVVYEQGGGTNGLNIWIESGTLHFGAWSNSTGWDYLEVTTSISASDVVIGTMEVDQVDGELRAFGYVNGTAFSGNTSGVTGLLSAHGGDIGIGAMIDGSAFTTGVGEAGDDHFFDGDILEIVQYNERNINTFHRKLITSYFEGKYGQTIADANDIFNDTKDVTYNYDIFGIGRDDVDNRHLSARSPDQFIQIDNATDVGDSEYLLIGHNNAAISGYSNTEVFTSLQPYVQRVDREWIVEEGGGDVGNVRFAIDTTQLPSNPSGYEAFFIIVDNDNDGDFTDDADGSLTFYQLDGRFGSFARSSAVNLSDGDIFTVGMAINTTITDGNWDDPATWLLGVPSPDDPVTITTGNDVTLTSDTEVSDLTIDAGGSLSLSSFTLTVNNTFDMNGTFNANTGTVEYASTSGDVCVEGLTYYNLNISGSGTKTLCGNVIVLNDIEINNNPVLNTDGTDNFSIEVRGNWSSAVNATFTPNQSTVTFTGTNAQTISKTGAPETFYQLIINKTTNDVTITEGGVAISDVITLTSGDLVLTDYDLRINNNNVNAIAGTLDNTSYIQANGNGQVDWLIAAGNTYFYPVGDDNEYSPFTFTLQSGTGASPRVQVNLRDGLHPNLTGLGDHLTRWWTAESTGLTAPNFDIIMHYLQGDVEGTEADLRAVKFNSNEISSNSVVDEGNNTLTWTGITSFSDFTAGDDVALPVELVGFEAVVQGDQVLLRWATASELNNLGFDVLKSTNGEDFEVIGFVEGNGNSSELIGYEFTDNAPADGLNYYQLRQIDFDGVSDYSPVTYVDFNGIKLPFDFTIYPNPTQSSNVRLRLENMGSNATIKVSIADPTGQVLYHTTLAAARELELSTELAIGLYMVLIEHGDELVIRRLIIQQ
jgi:hypothetical protein